MKLNIPLTEAAQTVIRRVGSLSQNFLPAVARGLDAGLQAAIGKVEVARFTGRGPFAPSEHRLGIQSGRLRQSLRRSQARIVGGTVTASVGSNVSYFSPHEFGFSGSVTVRAHTRTTTKSGGRGEGGRFKKATTNTIAVRSHTRQVDIPERAPLRTGMKENVRVIGLEISRAIVRTYKEGTR